MDYEGHSKLDYWRNRMQENNLLWQTEVTRMKRRDELYLGKRHIVPVGRRDVPMGGRKRRAPHLRNIIAENIESVVNVNIPAIKVTAMREEDEELAQSIEDLIRAEFDRLPMESLNDAAERMVPIQGGACWLVEWDHSIVTHDSVGDISVSLLHPRKVIPQQGVYSGIEDMDCIFIKLPQTKEYIERKYGVRIYDEGESEPDIKSMQDESTAADMVTQYIAYYRNDKGGIGLYSWVNEIELEDLEDYQARRLRRCASCGALEPMGDDEDVRGFAPLMDRDIDGRTPEGDISGPEAGLALAERMAGDESFAAGVPMEIDATPGERERLPEGACPYCGGTEWEEVEEDWQEVLLPIATRAGEIPGAVPKIDEYGQAYMAPTRIPFFKPDRYPIILQKNISFDGQFLGLSDVDRIEGIQNTLNRMETKIVDRFCKAGTRVTLPKSRPDLRLDSDDGEAWYVDAAEKNLISAYDFKGDLEYEIYYSGQLYEEARQMLGITNSFQGRDDPTALSGRAKEIMANQSAGRLESRRVMKDAAWAEMAQMIFYFMLAYADEPRPTKRRENGQTKYGTFNRYDFLEVDEAGRYYWNTDFMFSVDAAASLQQNRQSMWQETTGMFQAGAFGDPASPETRALYWSRMVGLHYPGAKELAEHCRQEAETAKQQAQAMQQAQAAPGAGGGQLGPMPDMGVQAPGPVPPESGGGGAWQ